MRRFILCLFLMLCCSTVANAAPQITSVAGSIVDGQSLSITGINFGSHNLNIEWLGGKNGVIESGTVGQYFSRANWSTDWGWARFSYGSDQYHSGKKSLKTYVDQNNYNGIMSYNLGMDVLAGNKLFISYWVRKDNADNTGQWKMLRVSGNETIVDGTQELVLFNWDTQKQLVIDPGTSNDQSFWLNNVYPYGDNSWYRMDVYLEASSIGTANGSATINLFHEGESMKTQKVSNIKTHLSGYKWRHVVWQNYFGNGLDHGYIWTDDHYTQVGTPSRVELGDTSNWSTNTHREIQPPVSWSANTIGITLNQGSFQNGQTAYLFVVDSNGNVNSQGFAVTIGASGGTDVPSNPTGLRTE